MYDYIRDLSRGLTEDQLADVFGTVALLNEQPACKDWIPLIASVGVEGMLSLTQALGGRTVTFPTFYQVIVVYAATMVVELMKSCPRAEAKQQVIGGLVLDGFDELVNKIASSADSLVSTAESEHT